MFNTFEFIVFSQMEFSFIKIMYYFIEGKNYIRVVIIKLIIEKNVKLSNLVLKNRNKVGDFVNCFLFFFLTQDTWLEVERSVLLFPCTVD